MNIRPVDPRDVSVETEPSAYRVYFWDDKGASDEYEITMAVHVGKVLEWADQNAEGRTYTVHALLDRGASAGRELVLLLGMNPTAAESSEDGT